LYVTVHTGRGGLLRKALPFPGYVRHHTYGSENSFKMSPDFTVALKMERTMNKFNFALLAAILLAIAPTLGFVLGNRYAYHHGTWVVSPVDPMFR
jgi:hypothetical protein